MKKESFNIRINRGDNFKFEGTECLSPFDNDETKNKEIKRIKEKYNIQSGEYLNINNFNSVYK